MTQIRQTPSPKLHFVSDNASSVCPAAMAALQEVNQGYCKSYGADPFTAELEALVSKLFETDCKVYSVFNGTSANSLSLTSMIRSFQGVYCHSGSHLITDESNAPGFFTGGAHLYPLTNGKLGKLHPDALRAAHCREGDIHFSQMKAVSITQSTEMGTVYTQEEVQAVCECAKGLGLYAHMDGARFANALATLECSAKAITWQAGIDVLSLGGTKNGGLFNELVVFFNKDLAKNFDWMRKQSGQLASKMRFLSAPWLGLLKDDVWLHNARHANKAAQKLAAGLIALGLELCYPVEANEIFVKLPQVVVDELLSLGWYFYLFKDIKAWRLVCSWDTEESIIDAFLKDLQEALSSCEGA